MLGEGIDVCSIEELHQLENQLERGLTRIRAKKVLLSKKNSYHETLSISFVHTLTYHFQ